MSKKVVDTPIYVDTYKLVGIVYGLRFSIPKRDRAVLGDRLLDAATAMLVEFTLSYKLRGNEKVVHTDRFLAHFEVLKGLMRLCIDKKVLPGKKCVESWIGAIDAKMTRSYDLNDPDMWENYGIGTHDGLPYSADGRISTKLLELQAGSTFTITMKSGVTASNANYYCYAADGSYIDNPLIQQTGNVVTIASILTANPTTKFVRLGFVSISGTTASSENIANIATFANTLYTERYVTHEELKEAASGPIGNANSDFR